MAQTLAAAFERLDQVRARRVPPHRDEKVIVSWNGLTISALAQGAQVLGDRRYYEAAARAARFLLSELLRENRLYRIWTAGQVSVPGFSEDYALLANALLELYETDFDPAWLKEARRLMALMDEKFLDPGDGTYFYVDRDQATPLVRTKSIYDQTLPSGNSMAARVSFRLHRLTEAKHVPGAGPGDYPATTAPGPGKPLGLCPSLDGAGPEPHPAPGPHPGGRPRGRPAPGLAPGGVRLLSAGAPPGPEKPGGLPPPWKNSSPGPGPTASRERNRWPISAGISPACRASATPGTWPTN